jgi:hypothetical protein
VAVTGKFYGLAVTSLLNGQINFPTATVKAMLVTSSYSPNQDTHRWKSDITGEATGTGYTAGGQTLTSKTVTYTAGTNTTAIDAADPSWTTTTVTARYLVVYVDTGTATTSPLICYVDFGADVTSTGGTFLAQIPAAGLATITAA